MKDNITHLMIIIVICLLVFFGGSYAFGSDYYDGRSPPRSEVVSLFQQVRYAHAALGLSTCFFDYKLSDGGLVLVIDMEGIPEEDVDSVIAGIISSVQPMGYIVSFTSPLLTITKGEQHVISAN